MRAGKIFIVCFFLLIGSEARPQDVFPSIGKSELPDAEFEGVRSFTDESLYGYIDGGAELYLEYGFDTLVVTEIVMGAKNLKVEVYRMDDAEAAFGIFSVSRFRCNGGPKLNEHYCRSAYQLQFCKGRYYVSIINDSGTPGEQSLSNDIAAGLLSQINDDSFTPDRFFPEGVTEEAMKSAVLVRGALGVFNGVPSLSETLEGAAGYTALVVKENDDTVLSVRFDTEDGIRLYSGSQKINTEALRKGETSAMKSGGVASMICLQHLLVRVH